MAIKNILFIGNYPNPADPYRNVFFQNLIFSMADMGIHCTVIMPVSITHYKDKAFTIPFSKEDTTPKGNRIKVYYPKCITYSSIKIGTWNTERLSEKSFQHTAVKTAMTMKEKFDCVYGHFFLEGGLAAVAIGRKMGIPAFIAFGECDFDSQVRHSYGDIKREELKGLSGIISVSSDNSRELKTMPVFDDYPVLLAPNAVDLNAFHHLNKEECRDKLGIPQEKFVVGFVGGFIERKGHKRVLAAVNQLEDIYAAFAGKGDDKPQGERVVFCKALDHKLIPAFLNAIDIFVLPTLSEGCCNAIIEAMACGLPIISSKLPFNYDILDETNSILVNPESIDEIKEAIQKLCHDKKLREKLAVGALQTAANLTLNIRAEKIYKFLNNM